MRATTRRVDGEPDPAAVRAAADQGVVWERGRVRFLGWGTAAVARLTDADAALAAIATDDEVGLPGCGPVAFGALPFDRRREASVRIPALIWGQAEDGTRWRTEIGAVPAGADAETWSSPEPATFSVAAARPPAWWQDLVVRTTKAIAEGPLHKVVLAREVTVTADAPIRPATVVARLRTAYPGCIVAAVDGFVGASPELLVSRTGDMVRAHPMAGTAQRGGDPSADARLAASLLASTKDRQEHQITIDMVHETLLPWCSYLDDEAEPSVVAVANVQHLATMVEGRLSSPAPSVLELVWALHPTPAVAGWPRDLAVDWIDAHEELDRARYAGPVGWVDARGNGAWAVGIRSAEVDGTTARVFAGNGIVADSDPDTELAETRAKLQALLSAIVRP
jgi:menaquinone-specific isochorismate synthase